MAKQRMLNTRFWDDNYTSNLDPVEKLLFLYCITNTSTNICGVYEIPLKKVAVETGLDKEMVLKILERFKRDGKIFYVSGWVGVKNFIKHQNQRSPQVKKGIEVEIMAVPKDILTKMIEYGYPIDTLSYLNLNSNLNSNSNPKGEQSSLVSELIDLFQGVNPSYQKLFANKTQRAACERLIKKHGFETLKKMISFLPKSNTTDYMPVITTPSQLEDKMGQLAAAWQKIKNKTPLII